MAGEFNDPDHPTSAGRREIMKAAGAVTLAAVAAPLTAQNNTSGPARSGASIGARLQGVQPNGVACCA